MLRIALRPQARRKRERSAIAVNMAVRFNRPATSDGLQLPPSIAASSICCNGLPHRHADEHAAGTDFALFAVDTNELGPCAAVASPALQADVNKQNNLARRSRPLTVAVEI